MPGVEGADVLGCQIDQTMNTITDNRKIRLLTFKADNRKFAIQI